jgi:hypothetical protein
LIQRPTRVSELAQESNPILRRALLEERLRSCLRQAGAGSFGERGPPMHDREAKGNFDSSPVAYLVQERASATPPHTSSQSASVASGGPSAGTGRTSGWAESSAG